MEAIHVEKCRCGGMPQWVAQVGPFGKKHTTYCLRCTSCGTAAQPYEHRMPSDALEAWNVEMQSKKPEHTTAADSENNPTPSL